MWYANHRKKVINLKNRVKQRRKELGLTQAELASQINISRQYISKFEVTGEYEAPSLKVANKIATALNTCIYDIFDIDGSGEYRCSTCKCANNCC